MGNNTDTGSGQFKQTPILPYQSKARRVAQAYDRLAKSYDTSFLERIDQAENAYVFAALERRIKEDQFILDLGCGTGLLLEGLDYIQSHRYLGIDISEGMMSQARIKFPDYKFVNMDMERMGMLPNRSYDWAVSLFNGFNYTEHPLSAIREVYRVLRPNGRIYFMLGGLRYPERPSYICNRANLPSDLIPYTRSQIKLLAEQAGFSRIRIYGMNAYGERHQRVLDTDYLACYLRLESLIIGRMAPDSCYFLILEAQKRE